MKVQLGATGVLAVAGVAVVGLVAWKLFGVDWSEAARKAGNAVVDVPLGALDKTATGIGSVLVGAVDAVPGLTDYLKRISPPPAAPVPDNPFNAGAYGSTSVGGQVYTF